MLLLYLVPTLSCKPYAQSTQDFFFNDKKPKKAIVPASEKIKNTITAPATVVITINTKDTIATVSKYLFGNNTNPYMTQIVTEDKLMQQLQALSPNILRFPGGNISNVYFWDALPDHVPADMPATIMYSDMRKPNKQQVWVGRNDNPNTISLDNYYKLLLKTHSTGTICVNAAYARYGTGINPIATAAHYAADWVRYDKGRTKFWEVGNEDYGTWQAGYKIDTTQNKDGQPEITNGALYGKIFKAFSDSMHRAAGEIGTTIHVGATLIEEPKDKPYNTSVDRDWNKGFFASAGDAADFFVIHSYYTPYTKNSSSTEILATATTVTSQMVAYLKAVANENNRLLKPIALTEWNIFAEGSKQQTSFINGMHAAIVLGEMAKHHYSMACRWDLANGYSNGNDHGMFNKGDEPGMPKWSARPVYYYMYYFQRFFGDKMLAATSTDDNVLSYASTFSDGKKGLVIVNKDTTEKIVSIHLGHPKKKGKYYGYTLTGGDDNGAFSQKVLINGVAPTLPAGGPEDFENIKARSSGFKNEIKLVMPPRSVEYLLVQ
ncbi:alpha-L-arabinofuranosidase [Parasediminibacterium sp. JCM 36343]|uniref:alpha-L-arabinofuranosidase n=1 Tax=Parasediminibacterium sp. JCM 36343 TaxID=3374279 RepID=UPI0039790CDC